jgi:hypothetical protein
MPQKILKILCEKNYLKCNRKFLLPQEERYQLDFLRLDFLRYPLDDSIALLILKVRFQDDVFPKKNLDNIGNNSMVI